MRNVLGLGLVGTLLAGVAAAAPVTGREAAKLLFSPSAVQVLINPAAGLAKNVAGPLKTVLAGQPSYGAAAISPDDGLMSDATIFVGNYHDVGAAGLAAVKQCDAKRTGKTPCVVAATVLPKGWKAQALQLSQAATAGFLASYPKAGGAVATSASTGGWAIGADAKAALTDCAKKSTAKDCIVVIAN